MDNNSGFSAFRFVVRRIAFGLAVAALLWVSLLAAGKPPSDVALLVTFGSSALDTLRSDTFSAPGYSADYAHGLENVEAILQPSGNFAFSTMADTRKPAERSMCFDFGEQVVPFAPSQCVNVQQPMLGYTGDVAIQTLRYGGFVRKRTRFQWDDGAVRYRLGYGTDMDGDLVQDSPAVTVTCIAPSDTSKPCRAWVLAPETDGTAALFSFALSVDKRGKVVEGPAVSLGTYVMPFVQTLVAKP